MLDHDEYARWLEASDDEGMAAQGLVGLGAFNLAVLHCEQAAQLALKGLLRGVGAAQQAWGHALPELAERAVATAGLQLSGDLVGRLFALARDYMPSRYPDALTAGTPRSSYGPADADRALSTLAAAREAVVTAWDRLTAEEARGRSTETGEP